MMRCNAQFHVERVRKYNYNDSLVCSYDCPCPCHALLHCPKMYNSHTGCRNSILYCAYSAYLAEQCMLRMHVLTDEAYTS